MSDKAFNEWMESYDVPSVFKGFSKSDMKIAFNAGRKRQVIIDADIACETKASYGCFCEGDNYNEPLIVCEFCKHGKEIHDAIIKAAEQIGGDDE